jgi:hypothetical protein
MAWSKKTAEFLYWPELEVKKKPGGKWGFRALHPYFAGPHRRARAGVHLRHGLPWQVKKLASDTTVPPSLQVLSDLNEKLSTDKANTNRHNSGSREWKKLPCLYEDILRSFTANKNHQNKLNCMNRHDFVIRESEAVLPATGTAFRIFQRETVQCHRSKFNHQKKNEFNLFLKSLGCD